MLTTNQLVTNVQEQFRTEKYAFLLFDSNNEAERAHVNLSRKAKRSGLLWPFSVQDCELIVWIHGEVGES